MITAFLTYIAVGIVAGVLAGLLGVGGGLVIVPVLVYLLMQQGVNPDVVMHIALGTSLTTIIFTSLSSVRSHNKRGSVMWNTVFMLAPGILLGAFLGGWVADLFSTLVLKRYFGVFAVLVGIQMALGKAPPLGRTLGGKWALSIAGSIIGFISSLAGIGGGSLTVPYLVRHRVAMVKAVGTSSACGLPIAVAGAAGFLWSGLDNSNLPEWSTGYLYWPAILGISIASVAMAPTGAALAHKLPVVVLKRFFSTFLIAVGLFLLFL